MASTTKRTKAPATAPGDNLLETAYREPKPLATDGQVAAVAAEALEGAAASNDELTIGDRTITITFLPYGVERRWNKIIGPYLQFLIGAWLAGASEFAKALSVAVAESDEDLTALALMILQAYDADLNEEWLDTKATFEQVVDLIRVQMEKNKVADTLGKLWGRGVLSAALAEALTTTNPPSGQDSTPPSSASAPATTSTPPSS